ncbi:MAG: AAA family ATPase, partial [Candidatus Hodarchaeales archaeon]
MLELQKLRLKNFKSFVGEHSIELNTVQKGLVFIYGYNELEPNLEANGVGKSTILDAIFWALFGRTSRSLKAGNVHTWGEKGGTYAELSLTLWDKAHCVQRQWKPNKLLLDGKVVTQEIIEDLIGMTQTMFEHSVVVSQFSNMFFDLSPSEKLYLFTDILNLDKWLETSNRSARAASELDRLIENKKSRMSEREVSIEFAKDKIDELKNKQRKYDVVKEHETESLVLELDEKINKYDVTEKRYQDVTNTLTNIQKKKKPLEEEIKKDIDKLSDKADEEKDIDYKISYLNRNIDSINKQIRNVQKNRGTTCPTCFRDVTDVHIKKVKKMFTMDIGKIDEEIAEYEKQKEVIQTDIKLIQKKKSRHRLKLNEYDGLETKVTSQLTRLKYEIESLDKDLDRLEKDIKKKEQEINPYDELIKNSHKDLVDLLHKQKKTQESIALKERGLEGYKFWTKGFKDIRLFIVNEALTQLELEVNNYLAQLGLPDWAITFDVERETTTGGISRGFVTQVHSPY